MKKAHINMFNELLNDKDFKGKKDLRHILWMNTNPPKFKVGDCFVISDPGHRLYGYPVKNFNAKIIEVRCWRNEEEWQYVLEMQVTCGDKKTASTACKSEKALINSKRCETNVNTLGEPLSKHSDSLDVYL